MLVLFTNIPLVFLQNQGREMLLFVSGGAASPVTCSARQACLGWCQYLGTRIREAEHSQINWSLGYEFPAEGFHLLCWGRWCCQYTGAQHVQSSLPSLETNFVPPSSSKELKWNIPLVFQIFCSRCSSHSAPLPRYGQMKPVRVCTHCYMFHVTPFYSDKAGIWHIKLVVCLLKSYTDWYIWPKPRINLKEGPHEGM